MTCSVHRSSSSCTRPFLPFIGACQGAGGVWLCRRGRMSLAVCAGCLLLVKLRCFLEPGCACARITHAATDMRIRNQSMCTQAHAPRHSVCTERRRSRITSLPLVPPAARLVAAAPQPSRWDTARCGPPSTRRAAAAAAQSISEGRRVVRPRCGRRRTASARLDAAHAMPH